jgi:hypothetical protein
LSVPVFVPCPAWGVSVSPFLQVRRMKRIDTGLSILFKKVYVMARTCSVTVTQKKEPDSSLRNVCVNPYNKDAPVLTKRLCKSKSHLGRNIATSEPHGRIKNRSELSAASSKVCYSCPASFEWRTVRNDEERQSRWL